MMGLGVNPGREGASRPCAKVQHVAPVGVIYARHTAENEQVWLWLQHRNDIERQDGEAPAARRLVCAIAALPIPACTQDLTGSR